MSNPSSIYVLSMWSIFSFSFHINLWYNVIKTDIYCFLHIFWNMPYHFFNDNMDEESEWFSKSKNSALGCCLAFGWFLDSFSLVLLIKVLLLKKAWIPYADTVHLFISTVDTPAALRLQFSRKVSWRRSLKHKSVNCANFHFVDFLSISCFFCFSSSFISCFFHSSSAFAVFLASVCSTSLLILCAICTIHSLLTLFQIARHVLLCLPFS